MRRDKYPDFPQGFSEDSLVHIPPVRLRVFEMITVELFCFFLALIYITHIKVGDELNVFKIKCQKHLKKTFVTKM